MRAALCERLVINSERAFDDGAHDQQLFPPGIQQDVESDATGRADCEATKCTGRDNLRDVVLAEQVEFGEDDTVWLGGERC